MVFPADVEVKLGFDQLRQRLTSYCATGLGIRQVEQLSFQTDHGLISKQLRQTHEFVEIISTVTPFPQGGYTDPEEFLYQASIEGNFLEEEQLWALIASVNVVLQWKTFGDKQGERFPSLTEVVKPVALSGVVVKELRQPFDNAGKLKDQASPDLARLRKRLREEQSRVRRLVDQIFRRSVEQGWVPDGAAPTVRDGRVVIPIMAEHKRKLAGFLADESSTGQTVFMEPAEVLEANNEIRDLQHEERREVIRILRTLTTVVREHQHEFQIAFQCLALLELTYAKAKLALELDAVMPELEVRPVLQWRQARHPLLVLSFRNKKPVVPLFIDLPAEARMLLVSGPNAGGKSVCLKTVGLLQYMLQCGLLVPVNADSRFGIFHKLLLDIGDQQSIENDLSTYSSHLRNLRFFLENADEHSLILFDELGAGTDPNFGGGIAEAVLKSLVQKKAWGIATTHYYNLKLFADKTPGIRNAAMLFDVDKLEPLFQLAIGKPGSSFALEIARKIGLPADTLMEAERIIGKELTGLENLLKTVDQQKLDVERRQQQLTKTEAQLRQDKERYERLAGELEARKKEIINQAKTEAATLLAQTNREIEKTIRHIKENKAEKKETKKVRENLTQLTGKVKIKREEAEAPGPLQVGDSVRLRGQEVSGRVLSIQDGSAVVQFGDLRSTVKLNRLVKSSEASVVSGNSRSSAFDLIQKRSSFVPVLDIRGQRVEEVLPILEQFLDDAVLFAQHELRIIHGKGEGVLRSIVRDRLKRMKEVISVADEHADRGGAGVTIAGLK